MAQNSFESSTWEQDNTVEIGGLRPCGWLRHYQITIEAALVRIFLFNKALDRLDDSPVYELPDKIPTVRVVVSKATQRTWVAISSLKF